MQLKVTFESHLSDLAQLDPAEIYARKHVLSLRHDFESGKWRRDRFVDLVFDDLCLTALSARERDAMISRGTYYTMIREAASRLRLIDKKQASEGSELAEIVLYGIMKDHYGALPVVPKIFYKQNRNDNAKGSDSVHLVIDSEDQFSVWLGEAKFFNTADVGRFGEIVSSVIDGLQPEKLRKEYSIISGLDDLDNLLPNESVAAEIRHFLNESRSLDELKKRLHVPILLLHECKLTSECGIESAKYVEDLTDSHKAIAIKYLKKQAEKSCSVFGYTDITFHFILLPVDDKSKITQDFTERAKSMRSF